ncbi:MAG: DUF3857 domain-containing protein [Thermoanaerobaculaceae bacterium]
MATFRTAATHLLAASIVAFASQPGASAAGRSYTISPIPAWVLPVGTHPAVMSHRSADGGVDYLLSDCQVRVTRATPSVFVRTQRRVATESGLDSVSQLSVDFDPSYQSLELHEARVWRLGRPRDHLIANKIKVLQREPDLEYQLYDGSLSAVLFLEDVRVGDVVEVAYTIHGANPVLEGHFHASVELAWSAPLARFRYRLLWPRGRALAIRKHLTELEPSTREVAGFTEYLWEQTDVPGMQDEGDTPPWHDTSPWLELGDAATWADVVAWGLRLYRLPSTTPPMLRHQLERLRDTALSPEGRALAAIRFVQDEIRYLGIEVGEGSHRPSPPELVLKRRFGDCKDKTLLLVALLRGLEVDASPALVNTWKQQGIDDWLPTPHDFNHVIVVITLDGKRVWVDPTRSAQGGGLNSLYLPSYRRALVLEKGATGLETVPDREKTTPSPSVEETLVVPGGGVPARLTVVSRFEGGSADSQRAWFRGAAREETEKSRLARRARRFPTIRQTGPLTLFDDRDANVVRTIETYEIPELWRPNSDQTQMSLELYAESIEGVVRAPRTTVRTTPLWLTHPVFLRHTFDVKLASEWRVDSRDLTISGPELRFDYHRKYSNKRLTLSYELRTLTDSISATEVPAHIDRLARIRDALSFVVTYPVATDATERSHLAEFNWTVAIVTLLYTGLLVTGIAAVARRWNARPSVQPSASVIPPLGTADAHVALQGSPEGSQPSSTPAGLDGSRDTAKVVELPDTASGESHESADPMDAGFVAPDDSAAGTRLLRSTSEVKPAEQAGFTPGEVAGAKPPPIRLRPTPRRLARRPVSREDTPPGPSGEPAAGTPRRSISPFNPPDEFLIGLKGWLVLLGFGLTLTPIVIAYQIWDSLSWYSLSSWMSLTAPGGDSYHVVWAPLLYFELLGSVTQLVTTLLAIRLFYGRSRVFPRFQIFLILGSLAVLGCQTSLAGMIPDYDRAALAAHYADFGRACVSAMVWVPYLIRSRRVRLTFVR